MQEKVFDSIAFSLNNLKHLVILIVFTNFYITKQANSFDQSAQFSVIDSWWEIDRGNSQNKCSNQGILKDQKIVLLYDDWTRVRASTRLLCVKVKHPTNLLNDIEQSFQLRFKAHPSKAFKWINLSKYRLKSFTDLNDTHNSISLYGVELDQFDPFNLNNECLSHDVAFWKANKNNQSEIESIMEIFLSFNMNRAFAKTFYIDFFGFDSEVVKNRLIKNCGYSRIY